MEPTNTRRSGWLGYCLVSVVIWGVWGIMPYEKSKAMSDEVMAVLMAAGLLGVAGVLVLWGKLKSSVITRRGIIISIATGLFGSAGNYFVLRAIAAGGEASVVFPLTGTYPLVTLLLAIAMLKERINGVQMLGVVVSIVAILLFSGLTGQSLESFSKAGGGAWLWYSLVALVFFGITGVTQKMAMNHIGPEPGTIFFALGFVPVAVAIVILNPGLSWSLPGKDWVVGLAWGVLIGLAMIVGLEAYKRGKAAIVTSLTALYPVVTVLLAAMIYAEKFTLPKVIAICLALGAAVAMAFETTVEPPVEGT